MLASSVDDLDDIRYLKDYFSAVYGAAFGRKAGHMVHVIWAEQVMEDGMENELHSVLKQAYLELHQLDTETKDDVDVYFKSRTIASKYMGAVLQMMLPLHHRARAAIANRFERLLAEAEKGEAEAAQTADSRYVSIA